MRSLSQTEALYSDDLPSGCLAGFVTGQNLVAPFVGLAGALFWTLSPALRVLPQAQSTPV
jgi:hypothetical protein